MIDFQDILNLRIFDLTHDIYANMPSWPAEKQVVMNLVRNHARDRSETRELQILTHHGTHIDAPRHAILNGRSLDSYSPSHFIGKGAILNLKNKKPSEEITAPELREHEAVINRNEILLLCTGWSDKRSLSKEYLYEWPYLDLDGARLLSEKRLKIVGTDGLSIAAYSSSENAHPIETHILLLENGILPLEELDYGRIGTYLEEREFVEGFVIALPLLIKDTDGAPCRVLFLANQ